MVSIVLITYTTKLKTIFRGFKPLVTPVSPKQAKKCFQKNSVSLNKSKNFFGKTL